MHDEHRSCSPAWRWQASAPSSARHDGDQVVACDSNGDGLSIEANYRLAGDTTPGKVLHVAGAGNRDDDTWDKTEGANVEIRMCYRDGIVVTQCSGWQKAEA